MKACMGCLDDNIGFKMIQRTLKPCKIVAFYLIKIFIFTFVVYHFSSIVSREEDTAKRSQNFVDVLASRSSADKFIILAMADYPFRDMAMNLYETSFKKHNIENFLFIANGKEVVRLYERAIPTLFCLHEQQ